VLGYFVPALLQRVPSTLAYDQDLQVTLLSLLLFLIYLPISLSLPFSLSRSSFLTLRLTKLTSEGELWRDKTRKISWLTSPLSNLPKRSLPLLCPLFCPYLCLLLRSAC
jgi:hypothetical protein